MTNGCTSMNKQVIKKQPEIPLHQRLLTIDTHADTPLQLMRHGDDMGIRGDARKINGGQVDFIRMAEGGLDASFFAVFLGQGERSPEGNDQAYHKAKKIVDAIYQAVERYPELAEIATATADAEKVAAAGKRAIYIGLENGYPIGVDISKVSTFYDLGARYITLCHTSNNDICDSSTDSTEHDGLSEFGRQVVQEMNRLGMMVDVSHISDQAFYNVLEVTDVPVIASHSCARTIRDHPRNMDDDMLRALAANGGVVQMCILSHYVKAVAQTAERDSAYKAYKEKWGEYADRTDEQRKLARIDYHKMEQEIPEKLATVSDAVDHIDHMVKIAGIDHVGIGTDFDGGGGLADCYDVSQLENFTLEFVRRGYSEEDIAKIWGGNLLRVFRAVEAAAAK
ncbi:MAG: membrane dipeptidase [Planctomycetes bacterium]|nr:membrane dipeptidase [Planctomycetota bacterium]